MNVLVEAYPVFKKYGSVLEVRDDTFLVSWILVCFIPAKWKENKRMSEKKKKQKQRNKLKWLSAEENHTEKEN